MSGPEQAIAGARVQLNGGDVSSAFAPAYVHLNPISYVDPTGEIPIPLAIMGIKLAQEAYRLGKEKMQNDFKRYDKDREREQKERYRRDREEEEQRMRRKRMPPSYVVGGDLCAIDALFCEPQVGDNDRCK